jgi:tellurite resistance protein
MLRTVSRLPLFKLIAVVQLALLARRHVGALTPAERRRAASLVRNTRHLTPAERHELIAIASKLEPRAFAGAVADRMSPVPLPKRVTGRGSKSKASRSD